MQLYINAQKHKNTYNYDFNFDTLQKYILKKFPKSHHLKKF